MSSVLTEEELVETDEWQLLASILDLEYGDGFTVPNVAVEPIDSLVMQELLTELQKQYLLELDVLILRDNGVVTVGELARFVIELRQQQQPRRRSKHG